MSTGRTDHRPGVVPNHTNRTTVKRAIMPTRNGTPAPALQIATEVLHARRMLIGLYALTGVAVATWLSRLPSIRTALDLSSAELGTLLLVGSIGSLGMVLFAGALATRWGSRRTLITAAVMFAVGNSLVGLGPAVGSVVVLGLGVMLASSSYALANVPMNLETVIIERGMGRSVVPQFHAAFSVGSVVGSLLGAAVSWAQVPVVVHFVALSAVTLVVRLRAVPGAVLPTTPMLPATGTTGTPPLTPAARGAGMRAALAAWREPRTLLIGVIVMSAALSEGSANNWLAIAVVDGFERTEAVAAVVFGVFVGSMTVARLIGSRVIDRFGPVRVLVASGVSSLLGLLLFGLAPALPLAVLGVAGWGLGAGLVVPIGMAAVATDRMRAAGRVAVVSAFASVSSIVAPPVLGLAAESMGARHALMLVGVGMVAGIVLAGQVRRDRTAAAGDLRAEPNAPAQSPPTEQVGPTPQSPPSVAGPAVVCSPVAVGTC